MLSQINELKNLTTNDINTKLVELMGDINNPKKLDKFQIEEIFKNDVKNKTYLASMYIAIGIFDKLRNRETNGICDIIDFYVIAYLYYIYKQTNLNWKQSEKEKLNNYFKEIFKRLSIYKIENINVLDDKLCDIVDEMKIKELLSNMGEDNSLFFVEKVAKSKGINISNEIDELPLVGDLLTKY